MTDSTQPADPRAGRLCSNCNAPKPGATRAGALRKHCQSPTCSWWVCTRCGAQNDRQGRNSITALDGARKDGRKS